MIKRVMKRRFVLSVLVWLIYSCFPICLHGQTSGENKSEIKMQSEVTGEGKPIVLVGGGLTGWASWEPFVKIFEEKNRKVIRLQLVSVQYGLENRPLPGNYSIALESAAMHATLDELGMMESVDVVAWSFGGLVSLNFALDYPNRIRSITLIEPPALWVLRETGRFDEAVKKNADFFMTFRGDISEYMLVEFLMSAGLVPPGKSARDLPQWNTWVTFRQSLRNNPYAVLHEDKIGRLKEFYAPVLLVKGTGSTSWLHDIITGLAENLPNVIVLEFPGGHAPHLVSRESFLEALATFQSGIK